MTERVHSKFVKIIPSSITSRLCFTLTKCRHYHAAIQVFKSQKVVNITTKVVNVTTLKLIVDIVAEIVIFITNFLQCIICIHSYTELYHLG